MSKSKQQNEEHVIIVGVGLIGGSIAAAIRKRFPTTKITGIGRDANRLAGAKAAGLLTDFSTEISTEMLASSCVVVVCLPVHLIADFVKATVKIAQPGTLITDAGSVKSAVCEAVAADPDAGDYFVGAHPIAGGEQAGFEFADPDLFVDNVCVVTPVQGDSPSNDLIQRTTRFWQSLGCRIKTMTPIEHDRVLALTSHLPHVMAAVTTSAVGSDNLSFTGSGFRDTTRIAAGSPSLWKQILLCNTSEVIAAIDQAEKILGQYRKALQHEDGVQIEKLLNAAAECRSGLTRGITH